MAMTGEDASAFLRTALTGGKAREYLKNRAKGRNPFGTSALLIYPCGYVQLLPRNETAWLWPCRFCKKTILLSYDPQQKLGIFPINILDFTYRTVEPFGRSSGTKITRTSSPASAASSIPWLSMPQSFAGFRFSTTITFFPIKSSGWYHFAIPDTVWCNLP